MSPLLQTPIAIFSFNRPMYLRRMLQSLRAQEGFAIADESVHLFQDGARSEFSGNVYAQQADIDACVAAFLGIFPKGRVHKSESNIGIARNIRRGERYVFKELDAEVGYFFEDDLELGRNYVGVMEYLRKHLAGLPTAGYFAAYGDHRRTVQDAAVGLTAMEHNWGYGLFRSAWSRIAEWIKPYNEIIDRADYRYRSHLQIFQHYKSLNVASDKSSQDSAKALACAELGLARVMTDACFAHYIGVDGQSFNERKFAELGYDRTVLNDHTAPAIERPTAELLKTMAGTALEEAKRFRSETFEGFLQRYGAANADPDRIVDAQTAFNLFFLLMNRAPEPEALASAAGLQPLRTLRRRLLDSQEYKGGAGGATEPPAPDVGTDAAGYAFKLLTGRPAPDFVQEQLSGISDPLEARKKILRTPALFRAAPELRLAFEIGELRRARAAGRVRLVIGAAGTFFPGWVATNEELLDLLKPEAWLAWLDENSVAAMVAEHVWDYLDEKDGLRAARTCFRFLAPGARLRLAVADAFMPDAEYRARCKVGGPDGRKALYDHRRLTSLLVEAGFRPQLLEHFDRAGKFHEEDWQSADGHIGRSRRFDPRNKDGALRMTSLIVDAIKP